MKTIGIIGGSFDPTHYGHLLLAEQAADGAGLDRVVFMPARISPFKIGKASASEKDRYTMASLAIKDNDKFDLSDIELKKGGVSYTYDTLLTCQSIFGEDTKIFFICGTDSFLSLEHWFEAESIFRKFSLIVGSRPRYKDKSRDDMVKKLEEKYETKVTRIHMPKIDISSTDIKKRLNEGRSIKYLLPPAVEEYIYEHGIYQQRV